jgi:hypothetical protein
MLSYIKKYDDISDNTEYWNISMIVGYMKIINIDVPYQRNIVWTVKQRQYFIDSIINGFSIFPVTLNVINNKKCGNDYEPSKCYKYNCIDGKQRLWSIYQFCNNVFTVDVRIGNDEIKTVYYSEIKNTFDFEKPMPIRIYKGLDKAGEGNVFDRLQNGLSCTSGERINAFGNKFITFIKETVIPKYGYIVDKCLKHKSDAKNRKINVKKWVELYAICIDFNTQSWNIAEYRKYCESKTDETEYKQFVNALEMIADKIKTPQQVSEITLALCLIRAKYAIESDFKLIVIMEIRAKMLGLCHKCWTTEKKEGFNTLSTEANKYDLSDSKDKLYHMILENDIDNYLKELNKIVI